MHTFRANGHTLPLSRTYIMGILNVTPDSFSDGGQFLSSTRALTRAQEMAREGADIIDIGGQSTRPGYTAISPQEEWARIKDILPLLKEATGRLISVDTFYPQVAELALQAGADIINDVSGFGNEMLRAVAGSGCGCIVMHPRGAVEGDILGEVRAFFEERLEAAERLGVARETVCLDPGIGFGKTLEDSLLLIANGEAVKVPGVAYLMAASRKRVTGAPCGDPPFEERLPATLAAHTVAVWGGADMVRVHDVKEAVQAAQMADALKACRKGHQHG